MLLHPSLACSAGLPAWLSRNQPALPCQCPWWPSPPALRRTSICCSYLPAPLLPHLQAWYLENIVVPAATAQGLEEEYRYLRPSIQRFPAGRQQVCVGGAHEAREPLRVCCPAPRERPTGGVQCALPVSLTAHGTTHCYPAGAPSSGCGLHQGGALCHWFWSDGRARRHKMNRGCAAHPPAAARSTLVGGRAVHRACTWRDVV